VATAQIEADFSGSCPASVSGTIVIVGTGSRSCSVTFSYTGFKQAAVVAEGT
jgi:hypothetical protein